MVVILFALGFHEYSHAKFADLAGDPTPRAMGRVTLNPFNHLDPIGTIMIIFSSLSGIGIGWGRPVLVDPRQMKNPRWDHFISVIAGPLSNLLQAVIYALVLRVMLNTGFIQGLDDPGLATTFLFFGVVINVSLFMFNMLPIGPLDGHWLIGTFLPEPTRLAWYRFNRGPGALIFLILVLVPAGSSFDILGRVYFPFVLRISRFLLGGG